MEKKYYYESEGKLVAFKPTKVYLAYDKNVDDWQMTNLFGKKSNGDTIEVGAGTKLYNSVEKYKERKETLLSVNDAYALFRSHKIFENRKSNILYYGTGIEINATNYTICVDVENDEYFFVELPNVPMFYTNRDACLFASPLVVDDEDGETIIPAERDKYLFTDEQKKAIEKVQLALANAEKLGLTIEYDYEDGRLIAFRKDRLYSSYDGEDEEMTDKVWDDKEIISRVFSLDCCYEDNKFYKVNN